MASNDPMQPSQPRHDRRRFLRLAAGVTTGALLSGCGAGGSTPGDSIRTVAGTAVPVAGATSAGTGAGTGAGAATGQVPLNLALNLAYLGAQYYGHAAGGTGLPATLTGGVGVAGPVSGARRASFADALTASHAAELAGDKQAHVVALRAYLGELAAAQPALDLSPAPSGAFSLAAQRAGIVPAGGAFDPYADDSGFLLGAFLIQNAVAAAYRTLLAQTEPAAAALVGANLADSIYHGGLIRALLDDRAARDPSIARAMANAGALLAAHDAADAGDQTP
ncbi:ferritin-like domain-containing protein, partial [Sphingomonas bacterium]|uniref:ferritin-like domain-containing protein n=1 Tax=Sphingomonas bacterium TaxID=1895847 RepID=UPI0015768FBD